jgi:hypothetical protein
MSISLKEVSVKMMRIKCKPDLHHIHGSFPPHLNGNFAATETEKKIQYREFSSVASISNQKQQKRR